MFDAAGTLVRTMSSILAPGPDVLLNVPDYWLRPPQATALPTAVGTNRTHWDLRYDNPPVFSHDTTLTISAVPHDTPLDREGPLALPGAYTVKLTVDGKVYSQALVVHNDPRSGERPATLQALQSAHKLVMLAYQGMKDAYTGNSEVAALRAQIKSLADGPLPPDVAAAATALDAKLATLGGSGSRPSAAPGGVVAFTAFNGSYDFFGGIVNNVGHLDMAPSQPQIKSWETDCGKFNMTVTAWKAAESQDVVVFNALLTRNNLKPLLITPTALTVHDCHFIPAAAHGKH